MDENTVVIRSPIKSKEILDALNSDEYAFPEVKPDVDYSKFEIDIVKQILEGGKP